MSNEMTTKQDHVPATTMSNMPEFQAPEKDENIRMPRLVLIQEKSPLIDQGVAKKGDIINSLSKENYGNNIEIVPLIQTKSSRIRWKARSNGGGILCIARDGEHGQGDPGGECAICPFFTALKGTGPQDQNWCSKNIQVIALTRESREPILLTADSTRPSDMGIRDMLTMARMAAARGLRMFQKSYVITSMETKNAMGTFFKLTCVPGNKNQPLPDEEFEFLKMQMEFFSGTKLETEHEETPF